MFRVDVFDTKARYTPFLQDKFLQDMQESFMTSELEVSKAGGILEIVLHRPAAKNAINVSMYKAMAQAFEDAAQDATLRVVLVRGEGGTFTSGNDLADFANGDPIDDAHPLLRFMRGLAVCPLPVVAAVDGVAVGIGTTMLLHCDLVYASPDAIFRLPFVNLGLCPEYASSLLLPRLVGHVRAAELLMLGEKFYAKAALDFGLINEVHSNPGERAREQCQKLCAQAPEAVRITKQLLKADLNESVFKAMQAEGELFKQRLQSAEFNEAVSAFFEKRPADFSKIT